MTEWKYTLGNTKSKRYLISFIIVLLAVAIFQVSGLVYSQSDLDITGYKEGIHTAINLGEGRDKTPDGLISAQGFFKGVSTGFLIGEEGNIEPLFIYHDVEIISEVSSLLSFHLKEFMEQSTQRSDALDAYANELLVQQQVVVNRIDILGRQIESYQNAYTASQQEQDTVQTNVFAAIDNKYPLEAEENLKKYLVLKNRTGELATRQNVLQVLLDKYSIARELLNDKIEFIRANREALLKGVTVVDIPDPEIQLIIPRAEWERSIP